MSATTAADEIVYPDSDGEPMAENDLQFRWIVTLQGGLDALFRAVADVNVKGDMLWYPVEGRPDVRGAPDVMVIFGRPKGDRGSWRQFEEAGVGPQVTIEVLSPGNRAGEMARKKLFYESHGVEEYYVYDPYRVAMEGYHRGKSGKFVALRRANGHISPRLGVRFELGDDLVVRRPDGGRFLTFTELVELSEARQADAERERQAAERERQAAERERQAAAAAANRTDAPQG